jgi:DNA-binding response OmpR family regulator
MRILVVEDDPKISRFVVKGLREENHVVDLVEDGDMADERAHVERYDAILLDVLLPGCDGFEVCRRLRSAGIDTPVLMLTARDAVADRVRGLDSGADDYLPKPFAFDELLARIRALTRRGRTHGLSAVITWGPIEVDTEAQRVALRGESLALTATEYRLLEYLVRHAGAIVSRERLASHVWGGNEDASNVVEVYIGYLRRKLDPDRTRPLIHTVRGLGYLLKDEGGRS